MAARMDAMQRQMQAMQQELAALRRQAGTQRAALAGETRERRGEEAELGADHAEGGATVAVKLEGASPHKSRSRRARRANAVRNTVGEQPTGSPNVGAGDPVLATAGKRRGHWQASQRKLSV